MAIRIKEIRGMAMDMDTTTETNIACYKFEGRSVGGTPFPFYGI